MYQTCLHFGLKEDSPHIDFFLAPYISYGGIPNLFRNRIVTFPVEGKKERALRSTPPHKSQYLMNKAEGT